MPSEAVLAFITHHVLKEKKEVKDHLNTDGYLRVVELTRYDS